MILRLNWIWRIPFFLFLFSFGSILVWANGFKKSELFIEAEIWYLDYYEYVKFVVMFTYSVLDLFSKFCRKNPFVILVLPAESPGSLLAEMWSQWLFRWLTRLPDVLDVFWISYVRSIYVLCLRGISPGLRQKSFCSNRNLLLK